jgi:hypothetical protein
MPENPDQDQPDRGSGMKTGMKSGVKYNAA